MRWWLLYLALPLCEQFRADSATTEIPLLPSLNTESYILKMRNNTNEKVILIIVT